MMDFADLNLEKNQEIIVTTAKEKYFGRFNKLSINGSRLDVLDVKKENGKACGAFKNFFKKDVIGLSIVGEELSGSEASARSSDIEPPSTALQLAPKQVQNITQSISNFTYIQQTDAKYHEALEDISKQFVIGISADGCRGRIYNIHLLTISTADKVYIFDLPTLNALKTIEELKSILSSETHLKIVHDSHNIVDNFKVKFGFDLKPVIDDMLLAAQFCPKENVCELGNCVKAVLGIDTDIANDDSLKQRPFSANDLISIANKSAFLLPMYHKMSAKSLSMIFQKKVDKAKEDIEGFFDGLGSTEIEKLGNQSLPLQLKEVDFSVYEDRD